MSSNNINIDQLIESCKPAKKRGRPSHKRQLQEIREEKVINLQTSDSVITSTNLRSILTLESLQSLPFQSQQQLISLLPKCDQIKLPGGHLKASQTALSNEYFARFCSEYIEKLAENKLSEDAVEQAKQDTNRELSKLDPWKLKNFEPIWGKKLVSQILDSDDDEDEGDRKMLQNQNRKNKHNENHCI